MAEKQKITKNFRIEKKISLEFTKAYKELGLNQNFLCTNMMKGVIKMAEEKRGK